MKTHVTLNGPKGKVKLTFGIFQLKSFTKKLGCEPDIRGILSAFQGGTRPEAVCQMIRSGYEQALQESVDNKVKGADAEAAAYYELRDEQRDYKACEIAELNTEKDADRCMKALFSSVLNEEYDVWFERLSAEVKKREATEETEETDPAAEKKKRLDWDDIEAEAYGEIGLTPAQFLFGMSWGQYTLLNYGYWKKQSRLWEDDWARTREIFWLGYNSNVKEGKQKTRHELMPLPSDPVPKVKKLTPEDEQKAFFSAFKLLIN